MLTPSSNLKIKVFHQVSMHCVRLCDSVSPRNLVGRHPTMKAVALIDNVRRWNAGTRDVVATRFGALNGTVFAGTAAVGPRGHHLSEPSRRRAALDRVNVQTWRPQR